MEESVWLINKGRARKKNGETEKGEQQKRGTSRSVTQMKQMKRRREAKVEDEWMDGR